jgi:hypothetical protein
LGLFFGAALQCAAVKTDLPAANISKQKDKIERTFQDSGKEVDPQRKSGA